VQSPFSSSVTLEGAQRRRGQAGFTFLELMIVLSIIAVAATLVAPAIESGIRARAVRGVAATLRTMKSDAVISGHVQHLIIDPRANELRVEDRADSYTLGSGTQITSVHGGELDPSGVVRVNFYPNGSTSGVEVLVDDREAPNDLGFVVSLDPLVGLVTIQDETR
jgi:prepilin-type N-terminal cleavage/methylation domain-containing protein